jgi:hypothetical protein
VDQEPMVRVRRVYEPRGQHCLPAVHLLRDRLGVLREELALLLRVGRSVEGELGPYRDIDQAARVAERAKDHVRPVAGDETDMPLGQLPINNAARYC